MAKQKTRKLNPRAVPARKSAKKKGPRRTPLHAASTARTTGTVARLMPRGAPAIPPRIVDLFSVFSTEMGTAPKPRTSAALRSLDRTEWEQLADSIDWREKDGSELLNAFRASARSKLAGDGLRKALGYADQLAMTPDQRALMLIGERRGQAKFDLAYGSILQGLLCDLRWESVLCWVMCCCGCCRCWPIPRDWPFCRFCCRCSWIHVSQAGNNIRHARWLDFTGNVAVSYGPQYDRANIDIPPAAGGGATQADITNAITQHSAAGSTDHDNRYYTETEVDGKLATHAVSGDHDGRYNTKTEVTTRFSNHAASSDHDGRYYTETEVDGKLATHAASADHDARNDSRYAPVALDRSRCSGYLPGLMNDPGNICKVISGQAQNPLNWTVPEGAPSNTGYFKIPISPVAAAYVTAKKEFSISGSWGTLPAASPIRIKDPSFVADSNTPNGWFLTCHLEDMAGVVYDRATAPWNSRTLTISYTAFLYQ